MLRVSGMHIYGKYPIKDGNVTVDKSSGLICYELHNDIQVNTESIAKQYAEYFNDNIDEWTKNGAVVYFVAVNPVGQGGGADNYNDIYNKHVKLFNEKVMEYADSKIGYIDTFSAIYDHFKTDDGLHYTKDTSDEIYDLIKEGASNASSSSSSSTSTSSGSNSNTGRRNARVLHINAQYQDADKSISKSISHLAKKIRILIAEKELD